MATICAVQIQIQLLQQILKSLGDVSVQLHNCHCLSYLAIVLAVAPGVRNCVIVCNEKGRPMPTYDFSKPICYIEINVHTYFQ